MDVRSLLRAGLSAVVLLVSGCDAKIRIEPINAASVSKSAVSDRTIRLVSTQASTTNSTISVTAVFSQPVSHFSKVHITVLNGTADAITAVDSKLYSFLVQPQQDGLVVISVTAGAVTDSMGNAFGASNTLEFTYDQTLPTIRDLNFSNGGLSKSPTPQVNFRLNKAASVTLFLGSCHEDFKISNSEEKQGTGSIESISVTEGFITDGSYPVMIQAQLGEKVGTCMKVGDYSYDTKRPTVLLASQTTNLVNGPFLVTATFSESVAGPSRSDVFVDGGSLFTDPTVVPDTNYTQYQFTVSPIAQGTITVRLADSATTDTALNLSEVSNDLTRNHDNIAPTVTLTSTASPYVKEPFEVSVQFSESVVGFSTLGILVQGGSASNLQPTPGSDSKEFTFTVEPNIEGQIRVSVLAQSAQDAALNGNSASAVLTRIHDTQNPSVSLSSTSGDYLNSSFQVLVTFSEPVTLSSTPPNLQGITGTLTALSPVAASEVPGFGHTQFTFTATPTQEGEAQLTILAGTALDRVGNPNSASAVSLRRTYDITPPSLISLTSSSASRVNQPFNVTLEFSEPISSFLRSDLQLVNGTASGPTELPGSNGTRFEFVITPTSQGTVNVSAATGGAKDRAGNGMLSSALNISRVFDTILPTLNMTSSAEPFVNSSFIATLEFSELVTGFDMTDLQATGASLSNWVVLEPNKKFELEVTPTAEGEVSLVLKSGSIQDLTGNSNEVSGVFSRIYDVTKPTVTLTSSASEEVNGIFSVAAEFTEPMKTLSSGAIALTGARVVGSPVARVGSNSAIWDIPIEPQTPGPITVQVLENSATDRAGNLTSASNVMSKTYDATAPSISSISIAPSQSPTNIQILSVDFHVNEMATLTLHQGSSCNNPISDALTGVSGAQNFFTHSLADGHYSVYLRAQDLAGNVTCTVAKNTHVVDTVAPTVSLVGTPASGATTNGNITVTATLSESSTNFIASDISVSQGSVTSFSGSGTSYSFTVAPSTDGDFTVQVLTNKFSDTAGNNNTTASNTLTYTRDTAPPHNTTVNITNSNPTNSNTLTLSLSAQDTTAIEMQLTLSDIAAGPTCSGDWESFNPSKTIPVPEILKNGTLYVDVRFRDFFLQTSSCIRAQILHDNISPATPSAMSINDGAAVTNSSVVTVKVTSGDGPHEVALSQNSNFCTDDAFLVNWVIFGGSATKSLSHTLTDLNATNTIYARVRDQAGNISGCLNSSIVHSNTTPINPGISIAGGATRTNQTQVTLTLSMTPSGSNNNEMYITNTPGCTAGGNWEDYSPSKLHTLSPLNQTTEVYVKYRDKNAPFYATDCVSDSILHDDIAPLGTGLSLNSGEVATTNPNITIRPSASPAENPTTEYFMDIFESNNCTGTSLTNGWVVFSTSFPYSTPTNKQNTQLNFSVKFKDQTGNQTECATATIMHDNRQPTIASIDKSAGPLLGGVPATLIGTNFRSGAENAVYFGSRKATCTLVGAPVNGLYSQLSCTVPAPSPALTSAVTVAVTVTNPSTLFATSDYTYQEAPSIASVTTERGTSTGLTRTSESITLTGSFFRTGINVSVGGLPATDVSLRSSNQVSFTNPAFSTTSSQNILVTNSDNQSGSFSWSIQERCTAKCGGASGGCYDQAQAIAQSCAILEDGNESSSPLYLDYVTRIPTIYINSNQLQTNNREVTLSLSASYLKATEMYITHTAGCGSGGQWEPYALRKKWSLTTGEGTKTVYVKYRDSSGVSTSCVNDVITLVSTSPTTTVGALQLGLWVETLGDKMLKASGLWADGWQYKLNHNGKGHNQTAGNEYLATQNNFLHLEGRTNPVNVFLDDSSKFTTGKWVFYSQGYPTTATTTIALNREEAASPAGESVDWLKLWNSGYTTNDFQSVPSEKAAWYEGNIKLCSEWGTRLPTLFETQIANPSGLTNSQLPLADGTAEFSPLGRGVPNTSLPMWTATSNPEDTEFGEFWWVMFDSTVNDYFGNPAKYNSPVFKVRCVLP
ncbi:hypothetical protein EBR78_01330 [bacterium]|nr:hypothetical protein [bacterium]